jgi:hypothetical protein
MHAFDCFLIDCIPLSWFAGVSALLVLLAALLVIDKIDMQSPAWTSPVLNCAGFAGFYL